MAKLKHYFTAFVCMVGSACTPVAKTPQHHGAGADRWVVYYATELPASAFKDYDLVIFDRRFHPDFFSLKGKTTVLGYISLGEVHGDTQDQELLAQQQALIGGRSKWNSYPVDITSKTWSKIIEAQVQDVMEQGFDGVFLDTVDSGLHLADMDSPEKGEAAQEAAIKLIKDIRERYPNMKIMLNRGFDILPRVAPALDYALGESMLTDTDISSGQSKVFPANTYQSTASRLLQARAIAPSLKLYALDYWNQDDVEGLQKLYAIHRAHGFSPYITTPDLRRHTPEPTGTFHATRPQNHLEVRHA